MFEEQPGIPSARYNIRRPRRVGTRRRVFTHILTEDERTMPFQWQYGDGNLTVNTPYGRYPLPHPSQEGSMLLSRNSFTRRSQARWVRWEDIRSSVDSG